MNEGSSSQASPTRLSTSGSGSSSSAVVNMPLEVKREIFDDLFDAALSFDIVKYTALVEEHPPSMVFEKLKDDKERVASIVNKMIGTDPTVVLKRYNPQRYAEDVSAYIEGDAALARKFIEAVGIDFFQKLLTPLDIYNIVFTVALIMKDSPPLRGFSAQSSLILVKHRAFGYEGDIPSDIPTLHAIEKAISFEVLFGDDVPTPLKIRMAKAINKGCRAYPKSSEYICQYMFEPQLGGVSLTELALETKIPIHVLGNPFAVYIDRTGLLKTGANKDSELPPVLAPATDDGRTSAFSVPRPPAAPPPIPLPPKTTTST